LNVAVITDSTSDLQPERAAALGIEIVPLYVNFQGRVLKDVVEISTSDVFAGVQAGAAMPSTSQPTPADFQAVYERALATNDHVLSLHISSKLSGTMHSAQMAAQSFGGRVTVHDTTLASGGLAMMGDRAARLLREGVAVPEVVATLEKVRERADIRFTVATLDFLRKNGRIGGAQALLGGLLNIKPLLKVEGGRVEAAGRARGAQKALAETVEVLRAYGAKNGPSRASYLYADTPESVEGLRQAGRDLGFVEFEVHRIGAVIASHVGPGTYGVCLEPLEV
jgi:DegV family protein with EDD domain